MTKLGSLRKKQLHYLADAYGIEYSKDCPKPEILPIMEVAHSQGRLKGEPKDARKYAMAAGLPPEQWPPEKEAETPVVSAGFSAHESTGETVPVTVMAGATDEVTSEAAAAAMSDARQSLESSGIDGLSWNDIRRIAKARGINTYGKGRDEITAQLRALDVE